MARRGSKHTVHGGQIAVQMSSGYTVIVRRPSLATLTAVQQKAAELHPYPEPPAEELELVTGKTAALPLVDMQRLQQVRASENRAEQAAALTEQERALMADMDAADRARTEYLLEYVFSKRIAVEGIETEADREQLIEQFREEREELLEWGTVPADMAQLDDWQFTLRAFVIQDQADYAAVTAAALQAFNVADISDEELRARMAFFPG